MAAPNPDSVDAPADQTQPEGGDRSPKRAAGDAVRRLGNQGRSIMWAQCDQERARREAAEAGCDDGALARCMIHKPASKNLARECDQAVGADGRADGCLARTDAARNPWLV